MVEHGSPKIYFEQHVLYVDTALSHMRLQWTPDPKAEESITSRIRWKAFWPEFCIFPVQLESARGQGGSDDSPDMSEVEKARQEAFAAFRSDVPGVVGDCAANFSSHQWPVMLMVQRQPRAADLVQSNPLLAYAVANNHLFRSTALRVAELQATAYCCRKQRDILKWLGFPDTQACVRLLHKLEVANTSPFDLRILRNALEVHPDIMKTLGHLKVINRFVIEMVANWRVRELVKPSLIHEVAEGLPPDWDGQSPADMILECAMLKEEAELDLPLRAVGRLGQVRAMQEAFDHAYLEKQRQLAEQRERELEELSRRRARRRAAEKARRNLAFAPFPEPPLPGTNTIIPLASPNDLQAEGVMQSNCVASYVSKVKRGQCYIYRVLKPERATLSIVMGADTNWRISELKGYRNKAVGDKTRLAVAKWLAKYRISG